MRIRRRLAALISVTIMLLIGVGVAIGLVAATQSDGGREFLRRALQAQLARSLQGTVHLGTLSGSFLTDLRTDSLVIRGPDDSVFVASGPIRVTFDPRDLVDGRVILRSAEITRPRFNMRRTVEGRWSHHLLWPRREGRVRRPQRAAFGSVFVIEEAIVTDGRFTLMMPWEPADSLRGARRDSAVAVALANKSHDTRRAGRDRYVRTWTWDEIALELPRVRFTYPDSAGRSFDIRRLDVVESNPPFAFRDIAGSVRWLGDSIWFDVPRFALPASSGHANGKIVWGSNLPIRYRARVIGDTVSLADIAWIDESLPTVGGGSMVLDIDNSSANLRVLEYAISSMDMRSHRSHLRGKMTWGVGGEVTTLKNVDLEATPLDFNLIERFSRRPLPFPFNGRITGRVRARGGPLNRFEIDDATAVFRDANVLGAESRATARGQVDILSPANTTFRGLDLRVSGFDLRTAQFLSPDFPRLNGVLAGAARLDSSWLDVRVSDADITHRDGDSSITRLRGRGRLTTGDERMSYELDGAALPLSFTALARSFPAIPLRGNFSGPLRVSGSLADLGLVTDLVGDAGRIEADMRLDAEQPGYRVSGRAAVTAFDPRRAFDDRRAPDGEINARAVVDVIGNSLADLQGAADLTIDRSLFDGVRVFAGMSRMRFADGRAILDTAHLESAALVVSSRGALGLHAGIDDSLHVRAVADSLGGLRRWLARETTDSLAGSLRLDAVVNGWLRDYAVGAEVTGDGLRWQGSTVEALRATAEVDNLPAAPVGMLAFFADSLLTRGIGFTRANARATLDGSGGADLRASGTGSRGTLMSADARVARDSDTLRVRMDSLNLRTARGRWALATPTIFASSPAGFSLDSLLLQSTDGASLLLAGSAPRGSLIGLRVNTRSLPLADIAELLQLEGAAEGTLALDATVSGTRAAPVADLRVELRGALIRGVRLDTLRATARAAADQLQMNATLGALSAPTMVAEGVLPLRLGFNGTSSAFLPDGIVRGTLRSDSMHLAAFEALTGGTTGGTTGDRGRLSMDLAVGGTWRRPVLNGSARVRNGQLALAPLGDVRWRNVGADIRFIDDSVSVDSVTATSVSDGRTGRAAIAGWMKFADRDNPEFDLTWRSREFNSFARRDVADVDLSGDLRLSGRWRDATLRGLLTADHAIISIPELASKDVFALDDMDRIGIVDTVAMMTDRRLPAGPRSLIENLTIDNVPITMGRDVWLRSSEANINLGGSVSITQSRVTRGRDAGDLQLALTGPLQTVRGTYRLNLGPVQRTFEVQSGEIRFFGEPELNPTLDISAMHTVRQYSQQGARPDVRVRVHIGGTLMDPTAELSTPDSARVTNADLISYLVTGGPSYEIAGGNADYTSTAARVLLSSAVAVLGSRVGGDLCDDSQISTANLDAYGGRIRDLGGSILSGTRFSCAKQLGDRAFVRLDAGLCQVGQLVTQGGNANPLNFDAIGVKLDYLLSQGLTASVGIEPPTSAVRCALNASARGFVPTPQQIGFDLFRSWRF